MHASAFNPSSTSKQGEKKMEVGVLGPGAVGIVTAARMASQGHQVIGVEVEVRLSVN